MLSFSQKTPVSHKHLLFLIAIIFAISATFLTILFSSAATAMGSNPGLAIAMANGSNTGILRAGEQRWFRVIPNQHGERYQELALSMFFAAEDRLPRHNVNFKLFTAGEIEAWQRGGKPMLNSFGAGMPMSRTGDPGLGERIWRGAVLRDDSYYMILENGTDTTIDYWLYDTDVPAPEPNIESVPVTTSPDENPPAAPPKAEPAPPQPQPQANTGNSPHDAIPLPADKNVGGLAPGQEVWHSFSMDNLSPGEFEAMALTMIVTPDDGNRVRNIGMEIFTAEGAQSWSPENRTAISNVGAGSVVYRDENPLTGEQFWSGWVVNNNLYYVRISNGTDVHIDYWLFNGDAYRPELGN